VIKIPLKKERLRSLFKKTKNKTLAKIISIRTPTEFNKSISKLKKGGITTTEKRALVLARTRAKLQLRRKNLSRKEKTEFRKISKTKLPKVTKRER
jgi:hypothetical protein